MTGKTLMIALTAMALLCGCEAKVERSDGNRSSGESPSPPQGTAEEGKIALKGPGFDFSIDVPDMAKEASVDQNDGLVYPGASITGLAVDAGAMRGGEGGSVNLRFTSADAPDKVAAWYRDAARAEAFALTPQKARSGTAIEGTTKPDGDGFRLELSPKPGGGTEARLAIRDRG